MFSNQTPNYGLPQWENDDKPTWLADMNGAFANIDENLKRVEEMAEEGGVPQEIIDRIVALETSVTNIVAKIGTDVIDTIGTSITNALVNLNTSITNITTQIGNTNISDIGDTITEAIRLLTDLKVSKEEFNIFKQSIFDWYDRIIALEKSVTNILTQIGNDVITGIGTSITNALVNLKNRIDNIMTLIGDVDISSIGTSITNAIVNLKSAIDSKLNKNWTYVGILSASTGSTITVGDDWTELLLAIRVSEGSSYYNLTNVLPKEGFTRGNPNGNQTFTGFFWNDSYNAKLRLGLEGTGDNRNLKLNLSNAVGWSINGIYVLKR